MTGKHERAGKPGGIWARLMGATADQSRDTGLALVLICLLAAYWGQGPRFVPLAIVLLLISMVWPKLFRPLATLWFGFSHVLGTIMSKVMLTIVFFVIVTPIGVLRRWLGADPLQLKRWKADSTSVFKIRAGQVTPEDLEKPY